MVGRAAGALIAASLFIHGPAKAQVAVSAALESDYRFRGLSLTDRKPALSLTLSYDHDSGAYFGASAVVADTRHEGIEVLGFIEYAGFVKRLNTDLALDVGVSNANLNRYNGERQTSYDYTEVYTGVIGKNLSLRGYFSPNYVQSGAHTAYLDLSAVVHPREKWRLFGHVGLLAPVNDPARAILQRRRYDVRVGIAREFKHSEVHILWTTSGPRTVRPGPPPPSPNRIVVGATYFF